MKTVQLDDKDGFKVFKIEPGQTVLCDWCGVDYTDSPVEGGLLFQSKATCPKCMEEMLPNIKKHGEERFIRGYCPQGIKFADWVRAMR